MSSMIDCLEFLDEGGWQRWVLVHHPDQPPTSAFEWTKDADAGSRFADAHACLIKSAPELLPMLPTEPAKLPMNVRVVVGYYTEPVPPLPSPAPETRHSRTVLSRIGVSSDGRPLVGRRPEEVYDDLERRGLA